MKIWNDFFIPLVFLRRVDQQTVQMAPEYFVHQYYMNIPSMLATIVIIVLPVLVLYLVLQNTFIQGLTVGAIKE